MAATEAWLWQDAVKPAAGCCFSVAKPGLGEQLRGSTVFLMFQKATLASEDWAGRGETCTLLSLLRESVETGLWPGKTMKPSAGRCFPVSQLFRKLTTRLPFLCASTTCLLGLRRSFF